MVHFCRLTRNGNALTVTVPRALARELKWQRRDLLAVAVEDGRFVACRISDSEAMRRVLEQPSQAARKAV